MTMAAEKDRDRLQVNLSEDMRRYLELKSELLGKPPATIAGSILFEAMVKDSADLREYLKLRKEMLADAQPD